MKRKLILTFTIFLFVLIIQAQNDTMYVHYKTYLVAKFAVGDIDSVIFYKATPKLKDIDGNEYEVITIDNQTWMAENLKTTRLNDGTTIQLVNNDLTWKNLSTSGYCWYDNDFISYKDVYGALYNWFTVNTNKLCPTGWHVPSNSDWTTLVTYLGGENIAGGKMIETGTAHWTGPNNNATNSSKFSGLPAGRRNKDGQYEYLNIYAVWWASTGGSTNADNRAIQNNSISIINITDGLNNRTTSGFSVRCIMD